MQLIVNIKKIVGSKRSKPFHIVTKLSNAGEDEDEEQGEERQRPPLDACEIRNRRTAQHSTTNAAKLMQPNKMITG